MNQNFQSLSLGICIKASPSHLILSMVGSNFDIASCFFLIEGNQKDNKLAHLYIYIYIYIHLIWEEGRPRFYSS